MRIPASYYAIEFINYTVKSHKSQIEPVIKSMMKSQRSDVATKGAEFIAAYNIFYEYFKDELEQCLNGTSHQRKGVASVAVSLISKPEYAKKCRDLLDRLINDSDDEVKEQLSKMFRNNVLSIKENIPLVRKYIFSGAFSNRSFIIHELNEYEGSVLYFADIILDICEDLSTVHLDKVKDVNSGLRYMGSRITELLLRVYEQSYESDRNLFDRCLYAWDKLFENRVVRKTLLVLSQEESR
ncbi:hypothetical protein RBH29_10845 [Herbivorax sp. ANBcel31]|uniref:hypothetical protein n=1 Tax=Herbivorax sp. ANBcel31 TaxID=3069754 RepID=UPI0027B05B0B|nr:hypothetical protein [Herbivorax sp. ANBcel31]MDQ2086924.1 hypothetical protein [Herbivorax sp. ANBcel31]